MRHSIEYARRAVDPTYDTNTTSVSKFRLAYPSVSIYQKSKLYFKILDGAYAQTGEQRLISIKKAFDLETHGESVREYTTYYKNQSAALVRLDKKIIAAVLLALVAMHTPFVPFIGVIAIAAWLAALYWVNQRAQVYFEYYDALLLLVATCSWCLGPVEDSLMDTHTAAPQFIETPPPPAVLADPRVEAMMNQLYLVLSKSQISHILSPANWLQYRSTLEGYDNRAQRRLSSFFGPNASNSSRFAEVVHNELESPALKQRSAEFIRCIYGLNRGTGGDFLRALLHAIPDLCYAMWHATQTYCTPAQSQVPQQV